MNTMPVLFIGHGSPMNAIEDNEYTKSWTEIARLLPIPKAVLVISAHWYTDGSKVMDSEHPKMIYDMYGFPDELYQVKYPAPGAPEPAHRTKAMITHPVSIDNTWGFDHGNWSVLKHLFPKADLPVYQLSIDYNAALQVHYDIGKELMALRDEGVLIIGSGNVVHNLSRLAYTQAHGFDWADKFDAHVKQLILNKDYEAVVNIRNTDDNFRLAVPTPEHFIPLLYVLGAVNLEDTIKFYNDSSVYGSLSMTSYLFGA